MERIQDLEAYAHFSDEKAQVTEIVQTDHSSIAVWAVRPGQEVPAHLHTHGQDTWVVLRGSLTYFLGDSQTQQLNAGDCALATPSQIHGAINEGAEDAVFVSIYSAPEIGYAQASP
ncbi:MAG: cupin domain-containing protein [Cyanobacteria bacterium QH_8_48_120]|nr:MAG: cupin domain-containing protein [Cyanobacteria bacterium QH_8_48_120]